MNPLPPVNTIPLFPEERSALLDLLSGLDAEDWSRDTVCPGWSVKDVAAHLLFDDLRRLSDGRDHYEGERFQPSGARPFIVELREWINSHNDGWVAGARGLSPPLIIGLLRWSGDETQAYFESLDPDAMSHIGVAWAGEERSANWFDLAREYSERWVHHAQIRQAVGAPMLYEQHLFVPLLNTMVRSLPFALRETEAADGSIVRLIVSDGAADGDTLGYDLVREDTAWQLARLRNEPANAIVTMNGDTAWRLFSKTISKEEAKKRAIIEGDDRLAEKVFDTVSIIV